MIAIWLAVSLVFLSLVFLKISKQNYASPIIAFTIPFSIASLDLLFNISKWKVNLQLNTFFVIVGGTICFAMAFCISHRAYIYLSKKNKSNLIEKELKNERKEKKVEFIRINTTIKVLFIIFQLISFLLCLKAVLSISRRYGINGSVSNLIAGYKQLKSFTTEDISLGKINNFLYDFCYASGFVWFFIVVNNYFAAKKIDSLSLVNLIISLSISLEKGSRGGAIALIVSGISMILIFVIRYSEKKKVSFKTIFLIIAILVIIIGSFQFAGEILGRKSKADFGGYISVYLSAPIRNLDYFINNVDVHPDVFGKMTFKNLNNYIGKKLRIDKLVYEWDLPALKANNFVTGNVYTTFYAYIYDFGFIGIIICMFFMGVISHFFYRKAINIYEKSKGIDIWIIIYSYIYYLIAFSFFSNKFYEGIFSIQFFKYLFFWFITIQLLQKIKVKK